MDAETADFARFYAESRDDCLRTVLASVGDLDRARELVDEAFARAWASWRKVGRHPAPRAWIVRTALNAGVSAWRRRRREVPLGTATTSGDLVPLGHMRVQVPRDTSPRIPGASARKAKPPREPLSTLAPGQVTVDQDAVCPPSAA